MKNSIYFAIIAAACFLAGCIDDKSTSLGDIPAVNIAWHDGIVFTVKEEGTYEPIVDWAGTSPGQYDYLWTLNGSDELSREFVLKHTFPEIGSFFLTFQMTDKETGIVYGRDFAISVTTPYFLGWLLLSEGTDQSSMLSFIHMQTFESFPDLYNTLYPANPLGSKPYRLEFHSITATDQILVMQEGGDGCVELHGSNFAKAIRTEEEFVGEKYPDEGGVFKPVRVAYTHKGLELLLSENGNIYDRVNPTATTTPFQSVRYSTLPHNHAAGEARFNYMTFSGYCNYQLIFDDMNKRWLAFHNTYATPYAIPRFNKNWTDDPVSPVFDFCSGMDPEVELVYAEIYNDNTNNCSLIQLLKKDDVYYLSNSTMALSTTNYQITVNRAEQTVFTPAVNEDSKFFLMHGYLTEFATDPHMFYSIGNRVYFYWVQNGQSYLYYDFGTGENPPSGELVTIVQNGNATQAAFAFSDGHFYICDASRQTLTDIRTNDPLNPKEINVVLAHIDDIPGRTVHAIFKYGKAANYTGSKIAY